ncbi:MAG: IS630 family transposase [Deltaproteobacteria bacterium]|nr:IS630 family transposase [Deltaproteobacteria bacterium]
MTDELRSALQALAASTASPHRLVQRARIVLAAADGEDAESIARRLSCTSRTVRTWKARWRTAPNIDALEDRARSGRPSTVALSVRCELIALACERPDEVGKDGKVKGKAAFRDVWTRLSLRAALAVATGVLLSVSEIGRILRYENLRPHRVRYWLTSKDPDFAAKAERICELYLQPPPGATVLCVDEKPVQVLGRKHPSKFGADGTVHKEYEYIRGVSGSRCLSFILSQKRAPPEPSPAQKHQTVPPHATLHRLHPREARTQRRAQALHLPAPQPKRRIRYVQPEAHPHPPPPGALDV